MGDVPRMDKKAIQHLLDNPAARADMAAQLERGEFKKDVAILVRTLLNEHRAGHEARDKARASRAKDTPPGVDDARAQGWYTPTAYVRAHALSDVQNAEIHAGITDGTLYAPTFYNERERYIREDFVKVWQTPIRPGSFAAGDGRWSMDIQFVYDRFLHYLSIAEILTAPTLAQREEMRVADDRIVAALTHAAHRAQDLIEAHEIIGAFLSHFRATLPPGPIDLARNDGGARSFRPRVRPAPRTRVTRDLASSLMAGNARDEAQQRVSDRSQRLEIAKRARDAWLNDPYPIDPIDRYGGHPLDLLRAMPSVVTSTFAHLPRPPLKWVIQQRRMMTPPTYVVWCLKNRWNPTTEEPLAAGLTREDWIAYIPDIFDTPDDPPEMHLRTYYQTYRTAQISWCEEAVASLSDPNALAFWKFKDHEEATIVGQHMRALWLRDYNLEGQFADLKTAVS